MQDKTTILLTGGTGFVGSRFIEKFKDDYEIVCITRGGSSGGAQSFKGYFGSFEDLRQLDNIKMDAVVHLAAVTGGCLERDGIIVNCEGTRCLMRYAAEHGCRRFVLASSIAIVGSENKDFVPTQLPMTEDEPCVDKHGYGFSKHLMEEVSHYHSRQFPENIIFNLRLGGLKPSGADITPREPGPPSNWWFTTLGQLSVHDAIDAIRLSLDSGLGPGVHTYWIAPPKAPTLTPVHELVEQAFGPDAVDLSHYKQPGHELDPIYSIEKARRELGWEPKDLPDWMEE